MIQLTDEENNYYKMQKICCICKKEFSDDDDNDDDDNDNDDDDNKMYQRVRDHCHYTGKFRGAAHNICNLRYKTQKRHTDKCKDYNLNLTICLLKMIN